MNSKDLVHELNVLYFPTTKSTSIDQLREALTLNELLLNTGFTLKPKDLVTLASQSTKNLISFHGFINTLYLDITAEPMYKNFPQEVLDYDEITLRLHQLTHYASTYGLESFGFEVEKGWLPESISAPRAFDERLLEAKPLELVTNEAELIGIIQKRIVDKAERVTIPEMRILNSFITKIKPQFKFKENQIILFDYIVSTYADRSEREQLISNMIQHPTDLLKLFNHFIIDKKLTTSNKRMFCNILNKFDYGVLCENYQERQKEFIKMLELLSYNRFTVTPKLLKAYNNDEIDISVLPAQFKAAKELRNGELSSYYSTFEKYVNVNPIDAITHLATKPTLLLRKVFELQQRVPNSMEHVFSLLLSAAKAIRTQTIVSYLNYLTSETGQIKYNEVFDLVAISVLDWHITSVCAILHSNLESKETPLAGRKVFIDNSKFDLHHSVIETNDKSAEGGYIRSGLAYKIPENVKTIRFFTYWNDKSRIDIDLHAKATMTNGSETHIGWDSDFKYNDQMIHSGDITHSDAAEYLDINLKTSEARHVDLKIVSYTRAPFDEIDTVFTGIMAVSKLNQKVKLYDKKNLIFYHELNDNVSSMNYACINVQKRHIKLHGSGSFKSTFSVARYIEILCTAQSATIVYDENKIDNDTIVLSLDSNDMTNSVSLLNENYFM